MHKLFNTSQKLFNSFNTKLFMLASLAYSM